MLLVLFKHWLGFSGRAIWVWTFLLQELFVDEFRFPSRRRSVWLPVSRRVSDSSSCCSGRVTSVRMQGPSVVFSYRPLAVCGVHTGAHAVPGIVHPCLLFFFGAVRAVVSENQLLVSLILLLLSCFQFHRFPLYFLTSGSFSAGWGFSVVGA